MSNAILPEISFADTSPQAIETAVIAGYEAAAGRKLYPGDPIRLFLTTVAAMIVQQRSLLDFCARQNLLQYAGGNYLDHLGALFGVSRLPAESARVTLRFTLSAAQPGAVTIPAGTRATPGGNVYFALTADAVVLAGDTAIDVIATCTQVGDTGNDYLIGQIDTIVDPQPWLQAVTNLDGSSGGAEIEDDDALRERIRLAPTAFSTAGPVDAYRYWASSASALIADVAVLSPDPGEVRIYPLLQGGALPDAAMLAAVDAACNDRRVRPLTDHVTAVAPTAVDYDITLTYYIDRARAISETAIKQAVDAAVDAYAVWQHGALGRDINPSRLIAGLVNAGARRVVVTDPDYTELAANEVAAMGTVAVTYGGLEDD